MPMFESIVYDNRRRGLAASLRERGAKGYVFLAAHGESPMNYPDNCYPFRQDSNWLYFMGLNEPDMAAFIDIADGSAVLFGEETSLDDMIWTGPRPVLSELAALSGIARVLPLSRVGSFLSHASGPAILHPPFCREETTRRAAALLGIPVETLRKNVSAELVAAVIALRESKEEREVAELEMAEKNAISHRGAALRALRALLEA